MLYLLALLLVACTAAAQPIRVLHGDILDGSDSGPDDS
jgi:hypothetical protein